MNTNLFYLHYFYFYMQYICFLIKNNKCLIITSILSPLLS